jgi:predicted transcriptional regulator
MNDTTKDIKDSQVSMRLPGELKAKVETYAQMTGRSKSHVVMEALAEYLDWRTPQIADLQEAVAAADRGEFASDEEVRAVLTRDKSGQALAGKRGAGRPSGGR